MNDKTRNIEVELPIAESPETVWRAITEADEIVRWFALRAESEPGVGGHIGLSWNLKEFEPGVVVRVCADSPLVEPEMIDREVEALRSQGKQRVRLVGNEEGECEGTLGGASIFSAAALLEAFQATKARATASARRDREHVGSFYFREADLSEAEVEAPGVYRVPGLRLCVDEAPDLELIRRVFEHFGDDDFTTAAAIRWLLANPDVRALNAAVEESDDNRDLRRIDRRSA